MGTDGTLQMFIGGVLASYWSFSKIIGHVLQWTMHWSDQFSSFDEEFAVPILSSDISNQRAKTETIVCQILKPIQINVKNN